MSLYTTILKTLPGYIGFQFSGVDVTGAHGFEDHSNIVSEEDELQKAIQMSLQSLERPKQGTWVNSSLGECISGSNKTDYWPMIGLRRFRSVRKQEEVYELIIATQLP